LQTVKRSHQHQKKFGFKRMPANSSVVGRMLAAKTYFVKKKDNQKQPGHLVGCPN